MNTTPDLVVGIDLGTTNSAIAAVIDGKVTVIPVAGQPTMPSAVGLDPAGKLIVGRAAKNQSVSAPEATVLSVKRLMGTDSVVELGGKTYRPEEISSLILGELKRAAESHLGRPVKHAVITVPAFFNERQRQSTQDAGRLAGLEVLRIINEPTAAALAYGANRADATDGETLLVYDLGGGTFDVSLVHVESGVVEVRASHGDTHLGGDDFDDLLVKLAEKRFSAGGGESPLPDLSRRRLKAIMEKAKISLSDEPFIAVREEYLTEASHLDTEVAREDYEEQIEPLLEKTLECLQRTLADAGATASQITKVLLVGGATRTPLVQEILRQRLGRETRHEVDPDLTVALGAAIQGAALAGKPAPAILIDITAHTYGIGALADDDPFGLRSALTCAPIVRRGTPLPVRKSEAFETCSDNQEIVNVKVFQGEGYWPEENLKIGNFKVEGLSAVPRGNTVVVTFQIDLNGMLTVTATEKKTGLAKSVGIDTVGHHRLNLDVARSNMAALFDEMDEGADHEDDEESPDGDDSSVEEFETAAENEKNSAELLASAKSLRRRAMELLDRGLQDGDADAIKAELAVIAAAIGTHDWEGLRSGSEKLSDLIFYLED